MPTSVWGMSSWRWLCTCAILPCASPLPGGRIGGEVVGEDRVEVRLALGQSDRSVEEHLRGRGEELADVGGGVVAQQRIVGPVAQGTVLGRAHRDPAIAPV